MFEPVIFIFVVAAIYTSTTSTVVLVDVAAADASAWLDPEEGRTLVMQAVALFTGQKLTKVLARPRDDVLEELEDEPALPGVVGRTCVASNH